MVIKLLLPLPSLKANKDENKIIFHLKAMMPSTSHDEKKKKRNNYWRKPGHDISECRKRKASEEKKKHAGLSNTRLRVEGKKHTLLDMSVHSPYTQCMIP